MPQKSKLDLEPLNLGGETIGQRIRRLRKAKGLTQTELAKKIGLIQALVSDYERGRLRIHADFVIRFAQALDVSTDELLGVEPVEEKRVLPDDRLWRRFRKIEELPPGERRELVKLLDVFLERHQLKQSLAGETGMD